MVTLDKNWKPTEPVHPSEILHDEMSARGMKQKDLAEAIGMKPSNLSRFFHKKEPITISLANRLADVFGMPAGYWLELQAAYERDIAPATEIDTNDGIIAKLVSRISRLETLVSELIQSNENHPKLNSYNIQQQR
ncbi:MAG: HigA family addiction module antidote protein [Muribaculaceae bacterium]|nr:HigA family addiction module antidote protein [Muribaculaceae bacterium]